MIDLPIIVHKKVGEETIKEEDEEEKYEKAKNT